MLTFGGNSSRSADYFFHTFLNRLMSCTRVPATNVFEIMNCDAFLLNANNTWDIYLELNITSYSYAVGNSKRPISLLDFFNHCAHEVFSQNILLMQT